MTKEEIALKLDGIEYGVDVPEELLHAMQSEGLVVVYGASDDLMELDGAIQDEGSCFDGETFLIDKKGILPSWDEVSDNDDEEETQSYFLRKKKAKKIEAVWCAEGQPAWTYKTDIPHASFEIMEDGEVQCRAIIFSIDDL